MIHFCNLKIQILQILNCEGRKDFWGKMGIVIEGLLTLMKIRCNNRKTKEKKILLKNC